LGSEFGLDQATIRRWVKRFELHGVRGLRKKHSVYDEHFRLRVLRRMWREQLSYSQAIALFDIRGSPSVVARWEHLYHQGGVQALKPKPRGRPKSMRPAKRPVKPVAVSDPQAQALHDLRQENEHLRAEVAYLKKLEALVRAHKASALSKRKP
jgi:transposase